MGVNEEPPPPNNGDEDKKGDILDLNQLNQEIRQAVDAVDEAENDEEMDDFDEAGESHDLFVFQNDHEKLGSQIKKRNQNVSLKSALFRVCVKMSKRRWIFFVKSNLLAPEASFSVKPFDQSNARNVNVEIM